MKGDPQGEMADLWFRTGESLGEATSSSSMSSSPVPTEQAKKQFEFENEGMPA
jgi:hypothetical protein